MGNNNIPIHIKIEVWERDNKKCFYCHTKIPFNELTIDHVKARSRNGKNHVSNYVCCCEDCNNLKGNMTVEEFNMVIDNLHNILLNEKKFQLLLKHFSVKIKRKTDFVDRANSIIKKQG